MTGQRIGYIRVSTFDQNPERQLEHVDVDRIFSDKASGKDVHRPQLEALMDFVREGDTVIVHSMDRLARNLDDLRRIVQTLTERGVCIEFKKEQLDLNEAPDLSGYGQRPQTRTDHIKAIEKHLNFKSAD